MKRAVKSLIRKTGLERRHVEAARMLAERQALALAPSRRNKSGGRILCYHSVGQTIMGVNDVAPDRFRRQIELALSLGYRFVPPGVIASGQGGERDLAVTFDDALRTVLTEADPILRANGVPYAVFVVSDWAEGKHDWEQDRFLSWDELARMRESGVELGSHSATHRDFGKIDVDHARQEFEQSRQTIQERLAFTPESFAIPFGQSANWSQAVHAAAHEAGYKTIYAQAEETRPAGTVPRTFVTHFDDDRLFRALLRGAYDRWEEWTWAY
jgi:peptidoglycan/xylan/chitin deacetylase (PgdA/CDA1 family)